MVVIEKEGATDLRQGGSYYFPEAENRQAWL